MRVNRRVRTWWRRFIGHLGTLVLSIVMGLIVWLIAINQENPLITQPFTEPVLIEVRNLGPNLALTEALDDQQVQLSLQAPRAVWETLDSGDITAYVDLAELGRGRHLLPVRVTVAPAEVVIKEQTPAILPVQLDTIITRTMAVTVELMDNTAFGFDPQTPIITPPEVTLIGPAQQVNQVERARVRVFMRGAQSQVERIQNVELVDDHQQPVAQVQATPAIVNVIVPVQAWPGRKQVAVRVDLAGQPADGFRLGPLRVDPSIVSLRGDSDILNGIGFVATEPVSVQDAEGDIQTRLRLLLPEGVTAFEGDMVDVIIGVVPLEDSKRITLRLIPRGLGPGLQANVGLDTIDVIVSGPQNILDALELDDVFAFLELNNRLPGSHVIKPNVIVPDGVRQEGVLPETVEVVITNNVTATAPITQTVAPTIPPAVTPTRTAVTTATVVVSVTPPLTTTATVTVSRTPGIPATRAPSPATPTEEN